MKYRVSTNIEEMDFALIHEFIANSYWAKGRSKAVMQKAMENSLCFGIFYDEQQIGFARMVTDRAIFAYLADVFIVPQYRGLGASKVLMDQVMSHADLRGLRRMMLATSDAHGLYKKYGFKEIGDASKLMEIASSSDFHC